jgi:hypothetical protein
MDTGENAEDREYGLATALLVSNGNDYIDSNSSEGTAPDQWWSGYDVNLGKALNTYYTWRGLLRRDFECGQVLLNQPGLPGQVIAMDDDFKRIDRTPVKKLQLVSKSAAVLLKPC